MRELRNIVEASAVLAPGPEIYAYDVRLPSSQPDAIDTTVTTTFKEAKQQVVDAFERDFITRALQRHQGNVTRAATEMGMLRQQLQQKIRELGLKDGEE